MKFLSPLIFVVSCLFSMPSWAVIEQPKSATNVEQQAHAQQLLQQYIAKLSNFKANFSQQVIDENSQIIQQSKGQLAIAKPDKLYWQVTEPDPSYIIAQGKVVWLYDPFVEQATKYQQQQVLANTPLLLLTEKSEKVWQNYQVSQVSKTEFKVVALNENSQISTLGFYFSDDFKQLKQLIFIDASGQKSHIRLTNTQPLTDLSIFNFTPPQGTTIDDQSQS